MVFFSSSIIKWYNEFKRDLPWRNTKDPYKIWLSEVILQQTQVKQGLPYYEKFIRAFPKVSDLANANEEIVLKLWQGLGYYSRARNLHFASKQISENGFFPNKYEEILKLKGVGEYTAAAIASFAFKLPFAVVDGNVFRLLSRFYGINIPIDTSRGKKHFTELAQSLLDIKQADIFNQAIMEFGSQVCKPKNPNCDSCVLQRNCTAFLQSTIEDLPVKKGKVKAKNVYFDYFFFKFNDNTLVNKRTKNGIWMNLYEFPLIVNEEQKNKDEILLSNQFEIWTKNIQLEILSANEYTHLLSHRKIHARFWEIQCSAPPKANFQIVKIEDVHDLAVSRLMEKFIKAKI